MRVGYGNDNDHEGNDDDVDSTDFTSTWKIYLILSFKVGAEGRGLSAESREIDG